MISLYIFIPVVCVLLVINFFSFKIGKKKGIDDFLGILFKAGSMGKIDAFKAYNQYAKKGGIVFVGDSITQDFNVYEYFPEQQVYNRGIGGDTSLALLDRLDESIFDLRPSKVFLQIGTNDLELLNDGLVAIYNRIKEVINKIKSFDESIDIYLVSIYPVNPLIDKMTVGKRNNEDIKSLNKMLSQIKGVTYINLFDQLQKDGLLNPEYTLEGLHLNQKGYKILIDVFFPYIQ